MNNARSIRHARRSAPATLDEFTALGLGPDRRNFIIASLLAVGAAGVPLPAIARVTRARRKAARFLSPARFAVLDALAETIMPRTDTPGARDALVPQRFDALMQNWASRRHRAEVHAPCSTMLKRWRAPPKPADLPPCLLPNSSRLLPLLTERNSLIPPTGKFKNLILSLYYISEPGATQELRYEHAPGAWEPNIPVTADTRAWAIDINV